MYVYVCICIYVYTHVHHIRTHECEGMTFEIMALAQKGTARNTQTRAHLHDVHANQKDTQLCEDRYTHTHTHEPWLQGLEVSLGEHLTHECKELNVYVRDLAI